MEIYFIKDVKNDRSYIAEVENNYFDSETDFSPSNIIRNYDFMSLEGNLIDKEFNNQREVMKGDEIYSYGKYEIEIKENDNGNYIIIEDEGDYFLISSKEDENFKIDGIGNCDNAIFFPSLTETSYEKVDIVITWLD